MRHEYVARVPRREPRPPIRPLVDSPSSSAPSSWLRGRRARRRPSSPEHPPGGGGRATSRPDGASSNSRRICFARSRSSTRPVRGGSQPPLSRRMTPRSRASETCTSGSSASADTPCTLLLVSHAPPPDKIPEKQDVPRAINFGQDALKTRVVLSIRLSHPRSLVDRKKRDKASSQQLLTAAMALRDTYKSVGVRANDVRANIGEFIIHVATGSKKKHQDIYYVAFAPHPGGHLHCAPRPHHARRRERGASGLPGERAAREAETKLAVAEGILGDLNHDAITVAAQNALDARARKRATAASVQLRLAPPPSTTAPRTTADGTSSTRRCTRA